jgi:hypothetical protein
MNSMGRAMLLAAAVVAFSAPVSAEPLPPLKLSDNNQTPQCATPGRMMAMLRDRNPDLRSEFDKISVAYMRHGEALGIRWDYAMFQMILETNALKFTGDVHWSQNNFAGLGATGGGVRGERFANVSAGAKAHLQHLMLYAGIHVDDPVAERTRQVQEWRILDKWRNRIRGSVTFSHIGRKWAPTDRGYGTKIQSVARMFHSRYCNQPDPAPELLAEARGTDIKPRTIATSERRFRDVRSSLGVGLPPAPQTSAATLPDSAVSSSDTRSSLTAKVHILNETPAEPGARATDTSGRVKLASAAGAAARFAAPFVRPRDFEPAPPPTRKPDMPGAPESTGSQGRGPDTAVSAPKDLATPSSCRVWTASYGGQKAIIIKSVGKGALNYTVLDVNEGRETREASAYIAAYARGGEKIGEFSNQTLALEKAFKLCPNG